jgi:hypothetical protein
MELLFSISSAATVVGGLFLPACLRSREYTGNNKVMMDGILRRLPDDACVSFGHWHYVGRRWTPSCVLSCWPAVYCAAVKVRTSEYDVSSQTFEVHVCRPPCLSWSAFERTAGGVVDAGAGAGAERGAGAGAGARGAASREVLHLDDGMWRSCSSSDLTQPLLP